MNPDNLALQAALYMDPRFNNINCALLSDVQKKRIIGYLEVLHIRLQKLKMDQTETGNQDDIDSELQIPSVNAVRLARWKKMLPTVSVNRPRNNPTKSMIYRLHQLQLQDEPADGVDVLEHWRGLQSSDPEMAELANVVLSIPASQVSVERAFSSLPLILTKKRTRLGDQNLERLLFVKLNERLISKSNK